MYPPLAAPKIYKKDIYGKLMNNHACLISNAK